MTRPHLTDTEKPLGPRHPRPHPQPRKVPPMITEHRSSLQGQDSDGERWAAHTQPLDTSENLIVIRSIDGKLVLDNDDAVALATWILRNTRRTRDVALTLEQPDEPHTIACRGCSKPLGMTTALEIVDGLCPGCWEKSW